MMSRAVAIPYGSWPLDMRSKTAAADCDEPSVEAFLSKVARWVYPDSSRIKGALPKWNSSKLDAAIAQRHGLQLGASIAEDVTALIG